MNKILISTALCAFLMPIGAYAQDASSTTTINNQKPGINQDRGERRGMLKDRTDDIPVEGNNFMEKKKEMRERREKREEMRERMKNASPEQRQKMMERREERREDRMERREERREKMREKMENASPEQRQKMMERREERREDRMERREERKESRMDNKMGNKRPGMDRPGMGGNKPQMNGGNRPGSMGQPSRPNNHGGGNPGGNPGGGKHPMGGGR